MFHRRGGGAPSLQALHFSAEHLASRHVLPQNETYSLSLVTYWFKITAPKKHHENPENIKEDGTKTMSEQYRRLFTIT